MANAFSIPASYGQWIDPINTNLVNTVLSAKQKTYDYNVAKVDGLIQEYTNLPLLREKDKSYLKERIDTVLNVVNGVNKLDMSDNNLTRQIEQTISTSIDDNVLKQMGNSSKILNFEKSVAEKREKKPELYSDINYSYAKKMAGVDSYMNETSDDIGSLQYQDYKDVNKRINDFIVDIQNKKKDQVIQIPVLDPTTGQPTGAVTETTVSGLKPFQVRQLAENQLDATYSKQIEINGWYNAGGYEGAAKDKLSSDVTQVFDNKVKNHDSKIAEIDRKLENKSSLSPEDIQSLETERAGVSSEKTILEQNKQYLLGNTTAAATFLEKERVITNAQDAFSSLYSENSKIVKDEVYFAQQDLNLKKLKLQYDIEKDRAKTIKDASGANSIITTIPTETPDDIEATEKFVDTSIDNYSKELNQKVVAYKAALSDEAKKGNKEATALLDEYNKKLQNKKPGETDDEIFSNMVSTIDYNSGVTIIGNKDYVSEIKESKERLGLLLEGKKSAIDEAITSHVDSTINNPETFKAFYDNPNTKMIWYKNGKLSSASVRDVFIAKGLMDKNGNKIGDIKQHKDVLDTLERSYYADSLLSKSYTDRSGNIVLHDEKDIQVASRLAEKSGETFDKAFIKSTAKGGGRGDTLSFGESDVRTYYTINPDSNTGKFLAAAKQNGIYDTFGFSDQSLGGDDSTIGKFINTDYKDTTSYKDSLNKFRDNLPSTQMIGIVPEDKATHQTVVNMITEFTPKKDITINLRLDGDYVIASQAQTEKIDKENVTSNKESRILKSDFMRNAPELASKLDFSTQASFYTLDKLEGRTLKTEPIKFYNSETPKKRYDYTTKVLLSGKTDLIPYIDASSAKTTIYNSNKILQQRYSNIGDIVAKSMDNSSNYSINATVERGFDGNPTLDIKLIDKRSQKVIHSISDDSGINLDSFKRILDTTPQVFYGIMINDIFSKEREEMMMGNNSMNPSFKNLTDSL